MGDRAYELHCLTAVLARIRRDEPGATFSLSTGSAVAFRSKGGKLNRRVPYIRVYVGGSEVAEVWTNLEFATASVQDAGRTPGYSTYGDTHELDIAVLRSGAPDIVTPRLCG
jgi:hypothetical protein